MNLPFVYWLCCGIIPIGNCLLHHSLLKQILLAFKGSFVSFDSNSLNYLIFKFLHRGVSNLFLKNFNQK